jgi:hypothetical protein
MLITEFKAMYFDNRSKKMKTFIKAITITIVMALFATGSVSPVAAQVSQTNQPSESVTVQTSRSFENEALNRLQMTLGATMHSHGGAKVLVIPTAQIQPEEMVTLIEDMTVMCRIFDKKMVQSNLKRSMPFYGVTLPGRVSLGGDSLEAMYVQGYGALFMTTVDFPLSAPPETEEKKETEEEEADPVWKQMRQEIFSPQQAVKRTTDRPEEKYDPEKVENLKTTLTKALVHAANIRGLNPDESVIITISGKAGPRILGMRGGAMYYGGNEEPKIISKQDIVSSQMVLVIRAKKSDIDVYAKNQIDLDEFKKKVKVISYPRLGGDLRQDSSSIFFRGSGFSVPSSSPEPFPGEGTGMGSSNRRRSRGRSSSDDDL